MNPSGLHRCTMDGGPRALQPRIDRLAFEREYAEYAFVHASQRLTFDEPVQRLQPERELP